MKAIITLYWNLGRPETWQNSEYGPRSLEKGHFIEQIGIGAVSFTVLLRTNGTKPFFKVKCPFSRGRDPY